WRTQYNQCRENRSMKRVCTRSTYPMGILLERALGRRLFKKRALGSRALWRRRSKRRTFGSNAQTIRIGGRVLREDDILLPEEVASRLKVPVNWVYEK